MSTPIVIVQGDPSPATPSELPETSSQVEVPAEVLIEQGRQEVQIEQLQTEIQQATQAAEVAQSQNNWQENRMAELETKVSNLTAAVEALIVEEEPETDEEVIEVKEEPQPAPA